MFSVIDSAKEFARALQLYLRSEGAEAKLSACQELTARICQYKNWHHLHKAIGHHPNLPNRSTVAMLLSHELRSIGLPRDGGTVLDELVPASRWELILHPNGAAFERYLHNHRIASLLQEKRPELVEFRCDGQSIIVKLVPWREHLPFWISARLNPSEDNLFERVDHPLFKLTKGDGDISWFHPTFRRLCKRFGIDPDKGRPVYRDDQLADRLIRAAHRMMWPSQVAQHHPALLELLITALDTLSTDRRPIAGKVQYGRRLARHLFNEASQPGTLSDQPPAETILSDIAAHGLVEPVKEASAVLLSLDHSTPLRDAYCAAFHFLPSEFGSGYQPSLYGWPGDPEWAEQYGDLQGVALRPALDADQLVELANMRALENQGVIFLAPDEAQAYLDSEGSDWAHRFGHGRVPHDLALQPRQRSWVERIFRR